MKTGCSTWSIFFPRSLSCLRTVLADFWSLKGKKIRTGLSTGSILRFSSIEHMKVLAISGPNGEPVAKPSICLYKSPLNWKSWSLVAIVSSSIRSPSQMLRLCELLH